MVLTIKQVKAIHNAVWDTMFHSDLEEYDVDAFAEKAGITHDGGRGNDDEAILAAAAAAVDKIRLWALIGHKNDPIPTSYGFLCPNDDCSDHKADTITCDITMEWVINNGGPICHECGADLVLVAAIN